MTFVSPYAHLVKWATIKPTDLAATDGSRELTYQQLLKAVDQMATVLDEAGIKTGQKAMIMEFSPINNLVISLALIRQGAVSGSMKTSNYKAFEGNFDWAIAAPGSAEQVLSPEKTILLDSNMLEKSRAVREFVKPTGFANETDLFRLFSTSGTTGTPKLVMINALAAHRRVQNNIKRQELSGFKTLQLMGFASGQGFWSALAQLQGGAPMLLVRGGKDFNEVALARRFKITHLSGSPDQIAAFINEVGNDLSGLENLKEFQIGGTIISESLVQKIKTVFDAEILYRLGSTEGNMVCERFVQIGEDLHDIGKLWDGVELEVVDESDKKLPLGEVGIIRYKTPYMFDGYYANEEATARSFKDGWFYPGDIGKLDSRNHLFIIGRESEMINSGGVKINPVDIDAWVSSYAGVKDCAAFGVADKLGIIRVWVAVVATHKFNSAKMLTDARAQLRAKAPVRIIVIPKIPHNDNGKPLRGELTAKFSAN